MKRGEISLLIAVQLVLFCSMTFAQVEATSKGGVLLAGGGGITSAGTEGLDDRVTAMSMVPSLVSFVGDGVGIGVDLAITHLSTGGDDLMSIDILPKVLIVFAGEAGIRIYASGGVGFSMVDVGSDSTNGVALKAGLGMFHFLNEHFAAMTEIGYLHQEFSSNAVGTFGITLGFAGFLF